MATNQKYMVIQMGQQQDELQDQLLIQFLSQNALAIKQHPGAVQFQVSKQMLQTLKHKFQGMPGVVYNAKGQPVPAAANPSPSGSILPQFKQHGQN